MLFDNTLKIKGGTSTNLVDPIATMNPEVPQGKDLNSSSLPMFSDTLNEGVSNIPIIHIIIIFCIYCIVSMLVYNILKAFNSSDENQQDLKNKDNISNELIGSQLIMCGIISLGFWGSSESQKDQFKKLLYNKS